MIRKRDSQWPGGTNYEFIYADSIIGAFRLIPEKNGVSIWNVGIDSNYRGIGLGNEMMKECVEFIQQNYPKGSLVFLWVDMSNTPAVKSYQNAGFYFSQFDDGQSTRRMEIIL